MANVSMFRRRLWLARGLTLIGLLFIVAACGPTPTASPAPTQTATGVVEPTATATPVVEPTATSTSTRVEELAATYTPTAVPTATPSPTATPTSQPTAALTATPTSAPTQTPEPTATPTAVPTATPSPTATPTLPPLPTPTAMSMPVPTPTARPARPPAATAAPASAGWRGEYYANPDLQGQPALVRTDADIGFDWDTDAPAPGLPAEGFSVRWERVAAFEEGLYHFRATMDDGMRVYVDDELLIDEWRDEAEREVSASRHMTAGNHRLRVEYYDRRHLAVASFRWEKDRSYAGWKGVYWANQELLGNPALVRDDPAIRFDWGLSGPGGAVPSDHFSARWTRTLGFEDGVYRFHVRMDDGVRMWVDDALIIDRWWDNKDGDISADYVIAGTGSHTLKVEYYDNEFHARIDVSWAKVADPGYPGWKAEYYANPHLAGDPILIRNDASPNFDWEARAPAPNVPADRFSVRWTREREIEPGVYRFTLRADDGVRLYVDDKRVIDEWHQSWAKTYEVELVLGWKPKIVVEMYEDLGDARIKYERVRTR